MRNLLLFFCLIGSLAWGAPYTLENIPNQRLINGSHVSDPDGIIDAESAVRMDRLLHALEQKTGAQVAVVAVESIGQTPVFDFAQQLFVKWGVGSKERNDGLLVLLVKDRRTVRLHTGYGLEGVLPDVLCKRIQREFMVPAFKQGNYGAGLLAGLTEIDRVLSGRMPQASIPSPTAEASDWDIFRVAAASFGSIAVLIAFGIKAGSGHFSSETKAAEDIPVVMRWTRKSWLAAFALGPGLIVVFCDQFRPASPVLTCVLVLYVYFALLGVVQAGRQQVALRRLVGQEKYFAASSLAGRQAGFWGWMAMLFPLPFLFFFLFQMTRKQHYRSHPRNCAKCHAPMRRLSEQEENQFLSASQQMEETLHSADYDVWLCDSCGATSNWAYPGSDTRYEKCPSCKSLAYFQEADHTLFQPTYESRGKGETVHVCKFCGKRKTATYSIAMLVHSVASSSSSSSDSSSSSSSSSGSSWGGGDSGGGGASSSW